MKNKLKRVSFYRKKIHENKFYNSLFKNSFWAFFGDATSSVVNLIVTIILIKLIGNASYGILVLTQSYMSIVDVSLNVQSWKSVIQFGQKAIVEGNDDKLNSYINFGLKLDVSTAILGGIVSLIVAPLVGNIFQWSSEAIICAQIFSLTIFSHLAGTSTAVLRIFNKFHLVAFQKLFTSLIKLISLLVLLLKFNSVSLITATIVYCITDIIGNILLVVIAASVYRKKYKISKIFSANKIDNSKEFVSFTLWGTLGDIVDIPVNYFDVFIISLLGTDYVSVFKVFKQCIFVLKKVTSAIQQAIMPQFSELIAQNKQGLGFKIVIKTRNIILKVMFPIALVIGLLSPIWLNLIYGELYADNWYILLIYLLIQVFALSYTALHPFYLAMNKARKETLYVFIANLVYVILAYILVKNIGMLGIVLSFAVQCSIVIYLKFIDIKKEV